MYILAFKMILLAVITAIMIKLAIPLLRKFKFGQNIREEGPKEHLKKAGTPTMGGLIFITFALVISYFELQNSALYPILLLVLGFQFVGFLDDYLKIKKKENEGLTSIQKFSLQVLFSVLFLWLINDGNTFVYLPFYHEKWDMGIAYYPFLLVVILGTVNGVNLTDGLDGLAASVTFIALGFFFILGINLSPEVQTVSGVFMASILGFLFWNKVPAKIFMGDTGSLALGGLISGLAIYLKIPFIILFVGIMYFFNALTVIIQVAYYKKTKKRIFKMAPFHHHLELSGMKENAIALLFCALTIAFGTLGYFAYSYLL